VKKPIKRMPFSSDRCGFRRIFFGAFGLEGSSSSESVGASRGSCIIAVFLPFPRTQTIRGVEVSGFSMFSSESEDDKFEVEEEDKVTPGARGTRNEASPETSSSNAFQFIITGEKSNLN
jgi:hypothetical protein